MYAGVRHGEVAGLRWSAVDFDRNLITVDRSYDGPTKSKHVRVVPLPPELAARLKRWRMENGDGGAAGTVITVPDKNERPVPLGDDAGLAKRTRRACKRARVEPVTFHQLRHTFASHLAERVPLTIVGALLGHVDPKTTARYAHLDTAGLARDQRLHLQFAVPPAATVTPIGAVHAT